MRLYPYTAYALRPSFDLVQVTLTGPHPDKHETDVTDDGKWSPLDALYLSKSAAIAAGSRQLADNEASIKESAAIIKRQKETLNRRRRRLVSLTKAMEAGQASPKEQA